MEIQTQTKLCTKCKRLLSVTVFGKGKSHVDGLSSWCRECYRLAARAYRRTPTGKVVRQAYRRTSAVKASQQVYFRTPAGKVSQRNYCLRNPEKRKAKSAIYNAIRRGDLPPASTLPCSYCTQQGKVTSAHQYHHHLGYSSEYYLHVIPLCRSHHKQLHSLVGQVCIGV